MSMKKRKQPGRTVWVYRLSSLSSSCYIISLERPIIAITTERNGYTYAEQSSDRAVCLCQQGFEFITGKSVSWLDGVVEMVLSLEVVK